MSLVRQVCKEFNDRRYPAVSGVVNNYSGSAHLAITSDFKLADGAHWSKFMIFPGKNTKKDLCVFDVDFVLFQRNVFLLKMFGELLDPEPVDHCLGECLLKIPDSYEISVFEYFGYTFVVFQSNFILETANKKPKIMTQGEIDSNGIKVNEIADVNVI